MRDEEHYVQDAVELYAVARLQWLAEHHNLAITRDSHTKHAAFVSYAAARGFSIVDFETGRWSIYKATCDCHLPVFFDRLIKRFPGQSMDFENVEVVNRNAQLKGDFRIAFSHCESISVSMKNYRRTALRPQLNSGTYNSFILNFLFNSPAVGTFIDPTTEIPFRSTSLSDRDEAIRRNGHASLIPLVHAMDDLNVAIRSRFLDTDEFRYLDEKVFASARKQCGNEGARIGLDILQRLDLEVIRNRLLRMIGMDGSEEMLLMDPRRFADSITNERFRELRRSVQDSATTLKIGSRKQGIGFDFTRGEVMLLQIDVPFTINKNGAWISGDVYQGTRFHPKEGVCLAYGERRPKKSRELATSINTYVNFGATGIFGSR